MSSSAAPSNFAEVRAGLYRGGHPSYDHLAYLKSRGVTTIVNLEVADLIEATHERIEQELEDVARLELDMVRQPMSAFEPFVNRRQMQYTLAVLATSKPADSDAAGAPLPKIYVHCRHGQDRTGLVIGLERIFVEGWTPADAYAEMLAHGFHPYFEGLKHYFSKVTGHHPP